MSNHPALLVLADGTTFSGETVGAQPSDGVSTGPLVVTTAMSGYQELVTDPAVAGQIVAFTYPHIGNCGSTPSDDQSDQVHCRGIVVRDLARRPSNWRATESFSEFLTRHSVAAIAGVDTRRLARHLQQVGSIGAAFGTGTTKDLQAAAQGIGEPTDLVAAITTPTPFRVGQGVHRVVALDLGLRRSSRERLSQFGTVEVVPAPTSADQIRALNPDGVFLSSGPGDPAALGSVVETVQELLGQFPLFGLGLGHLILARALGADTHRLPMGHHGANHPVRRIETGRVEITSQNHSFVVSDGSLPGVEVTHVSLNDGAIEGLRSLHHAAFGVQYDADVGPGRYESVYLFMNFARLMEDQAARAAGKGH